MKHKRNLLYYWTHRLFRNEQAQPGVIAGSERGYGIDVSHWETSFDPAKAAPGLIDFAIFKATEGTGWTDSKFKDFYNAAAGIVPILGAYHYLRSQYSADAQVAHFLNTIKDKRFDILVCDFEAINNTLDDSFVRKAHTFGQAVKAALPAAKLLFYTNPSTYDRTIYPGSIRSYGRDVFTAQPWDGLWIAQYYFQPAPSKYPSMPKTRQDWLFWQYSEAGEPTMHGTGGWCDQNVFNGTRAQLDAWIGKDSPPPDPPPVATGKLLQYDADGVLVQTWVPEK